MEFGSVPDNELSSIDFSLPQEPAGNIKVLGGQKYPQPKIYLGCARWGTTQWIGKIYPAGTKEKDFLPHYIEQFNCIELNATHYKIYDAPVIEKWRSKAAAKEFMFCPKMFKGVTHQGSLLGKETMTAEFLNGIKVFDQHLGPVFIQLSETFSPARKEELFTYLQILPKDFIFLLEVRHPEWFSNKAVSKELFNKLYTLNIGAVITDTAGRRDCAHMHLAISKTFIRYVGNNLHPTDYPRIDAWVERIVCWLENGLQEIYFIMHMHEELCAPEMIMYMSDKLYDVCGIRVEKPKFVQEGGEAEGSQLNFF